MTTKNAASGAGALKSGERVTDRIVEAMREGLKTGEFVPGQRLVEADLTKRFGVSRGPLREALQRLASEGLLVLEAHRGAVIRELSSRDLEEIYAIRSVLESMAARLAAENIDQSGNRKLLQGVLRGAARIDDSAGYAAANERFHETILELSQNETLARLVRQLRVPIFRYQTQHFLGGPAIAQSMGDHKGIAEAILAGNGAEAEKQMRRHIAHSWKLISRSKRG